MKRIVVTAAVLTAAALGLTAPSQSVALATPRASGSDTASMSGSPGAALVRWRYAGTYETYTACASAGNRGYGEKWMGYFCDPGSSGWILYVR